LLNRTTALGVYSFW